MPVEQWSARVLVVRLNDDPAYTEDMAGLEEHLQRSPADVVLDFAGLTFVNSSNLARLLKLRKRMIELDRRLVLCGIITSVWGTFLATGLDAVFHFSENVTTALAELNLAS